jgi:hypothetical protein
MRWTLQSDGTLYPTVNYTVFVLVSILDTSLGNAKALGTFASNNTYMLVTAAEALSYKLDIVKELEGEVELTDTNDPKKRHIIQNTQPQAVPPLNDSDINFSLQPPGNGPQPPQPPPNPESSVFSMPLPPPGNVLQPPQPPPNPESSVFSQPFPPFAPVEASTEDLSAQQLSELIRKKSALTKEVNEYLSKWGSL